MAIHFKLSAPDPHSHFAKIEMNIDSIDSEEIFIDLPSWRPGRYELGNFSRNIRSWLAFNENGLPLAFKKISKDTWKISTEGAEKIVIKYEYYCAQPDAGGCWIDEHQIYINPVHCFLFLNEKIHEPCTIELKIPENYKIATSLKKENNTLHAGDFHELYDSPFIASSSLQSEKYTVNNTSFYIWIQGNCKPDWKKILKDFQSFTEEQLGMMDSFPFSEYHFLVQVLPYRFYHGVEHLASTVLALGPGQQLNDDLYIDFTGVASHELFHAWNIKTIRPAEMHPYNYKKENYSRLGFVYEGVTTYYGDLFLARCGVYSIDQFFKEIGIRIQKHFDNYGRFNLSVADSSFDTWIDGYNPGIPNRKTSIYDGGCITALMTDLQIRKATNSQASLDDVMKTLYNDFGKKNLGYTEHDYISLSEYVAKKSMADFFLDHVYGTEDDEKLLSDLLAYAGCILIKRPSGELSERSFGFKTSVQDKITLVAAIAPDSPAFNAGLMKDDEIIAVNELKIEENLQSLLSMFAGQKIVLTVLTSMKELKDIPLTPGKNEYYSKYSIGIDKNASKEARESFKAWLKREFEIAGQLQPGTYS